MSYGLKFSKPSITVQTAADKDLVISSDIETVKNDVVSSVLSYTIPAFPADNTADISFTHSLGYKPPFKAFYDCNDGNWRECLEEASILGSLPEVFTRLWSTTTTVEGLIQNETASTQKVRVKIFVFKTNV